MGLKTLLGISLASLGALPAAVARFAGSLLSKAAALALGSEKKADARDSFFKGVF